jgi:hypothetical protein
MKKEFRNKLTSICRETAKTLDMARNGPRWLCEVTDLQIVGEGRKVYQFYIMDKNSGHEYQAQASVEREESAEWDIEKVSE